MLLLVIVAVTQSFLTLGETSTICRCVKPTAHHVDNNPCKIGECHLLMDYVHFPDNFSSNTTFKFLPGNHSLNTNVYVNSVHYLTLSGMVEVGLGSRPVVQCSGMPATGFSFSNVTNLQLNNFNLHNCAFHRWGDSQAILLVYVTNISITNVIVSNSTGYGVTIRNLMGESYIQNVIIKGSHNDTNCYGGNVRMLYKSKQYKSHSLLVSDSSFLDGKVANNCKDHAGYASGFGVYLATVSSVNIKFRNVTFSGNTATYGGNLAITYVHLEDMTNWTSTVTIDNCNISNGMAQQGGGLYVSIVATQNITTNKSLKYVVILTIKNTLFTNNMASKLGGGMFMKLYQEMALSTAAHIVISSSNFTGNSVERFSHDGGGVAINILNFDFPGYKPHHTPQYKVTIYQCKFSYNDIIYRPTPIGSGTLYFKQNHLTNFTNNEIVNNSCSGVVLVRSNVIFCGTNNISSNKGVSGGGIALCDNSVLSFEVNSSLNISDNQALKNGGGIYIETECSQSISPCFYQFEYNKTAKHVYLERNVAKEAGNALYGGSIDYCYFFGHYTVENIPKIEVFNNIFEIIPNDTNSTITSDPQLICFCDISSSWNLMKNCTNTIRSVDIYPGSTVEVPLVVVGQRNGSVPGDVFASNFNESIIKSINNTSCTNLTYNFSIPNDCTKKYINITFSTSGNKFSAVTVLTLNFKPCPIGFHKQESSCECVCHPAFHKFQHIECQISNTTIYKHKESKSWFGFLNTSNGTNMELLTSAFCPFDYCLRSKKIIEVNVSQLGSANYQCALDRQGILCGGCRENHSNVFGSSRCSDCSKTHSIARIIGLLIVFCIAGILLVVCLGVTDMTVAEGTINAIIFYVNVVAVNRSVFLSVSEENKTLTFITKRLGVFISWMNLDFGIEICFYDGMSSIEKSLLQYAFPFYLWCIAGAIIYLCRKSNWISRHFGGNSVKVLATVILLSYTKLLRAMLGGLQYAKIYHYSEYTYITKVWLIDGTKQYLTGPHILIFTFALFVGAITLPYTFALLFIKYLRKGSKLKVLFWVNKLKPFFDAYAGPYQDMFYFWTGFLLLIRLILIGALANIRSPEHSLTIIGATASLLPLFLQLKMYKSPVLTVIEAFTYTNLTIFCITIACSTNNNHNDLIILGCVGSIFILFCGIVIYHILKKLMVTRRWGVVKVWLLDRRWPWMKRKQIRSLILRNHIDSDEDTSSSDSELDPILQNAPPVARYDQLREPLIETPSRNY